ncbi:MAG: class I SAM-dependent methyltransferase [Candidatus Brocadia sp.]|nr:class I SAM-dependent methyltransferase [Candidatus Brocadia sp.]
MIFEKNIDYYSKIRTELIDMLPSVKGKFLEIGCGVGSTLDYLKSKGASYVAGVDINKKAVDAASQKFLDFVLVADVEKDILPFKDQEFDVIIFADIIEHLFNPWDTLKNMQRYLKDDGLILLSIPNIKNYYTLIRLIFYDEWSYSEAGILDNTHIRFFTLKEIAKLLDYADLKIVDVKCRTKKRKAFDIINALLCKKIESFSVVKYCIVASKK